MTLGMTPHTVDPTIKSWIPKVP